MASRYEQLRQAIANLAASAEAQLTHLDGIFGADAETRDTEELALEFEGIYRARGDMLVCGEISVAQAEAPAKLDALLLRWSGQGNADFWTRDALRSDPRWEQVRKAAREALGAFSTE